MKIYKRLVEKHSYILDRTVIQNHHETLHLLWDNRQLIHLLSLGTEIHFQIIALLELDQGLPLHYLRPYSS